MQYLVAFADLISRFSNSKLFAHSLMHNYLLLQPPLKFGLMIPFAFGIVSSWSGFRLCRWKDNIAGMADLCFQRQDQCFSATWLILHLL